MAMVRRVRPTLRCLIDDLHLPLPGLDVDLGSIEHPMLREARRLAPGSPKGQKRIPGIGSPLVHRIRVSDERGATWVDEAHSILWLCAAGRRKEGSNDDALAWIADLHGAGRLLPTEDDHLRDRAEAAIRLQSRLISELLDLLAEARVVSGRDIETNLGDWVPARFLVIRATGTEEIWCALGVRGVDGSGIASQIRDVLFASLEQALQPMEREVRAGWPTGEANGRKPCDSTFGRRIDLLPERCLPRGRQAGKRQSSCVRWRGLAEPGRCLFQSRWHGGRRTRRRLGRRFPPGSRPRTRRGSEFCPWFQGEP